MNAPLPVDSFAFGAAHALAGQRGCRLNSIVTVAAPARPAGVPPALPRPRPAAPAWLVLAALSMLYALSQLLRSALGVIAGDLEEALHLHAWQTAALAGAMFLAYGAAQIPGGLILDRFGAGRVLPLCCALLAAGAAGFAAAPGFAGLLAARVVMGMAAAPIYAGALSLYFDGNSPQRFAWLSSVITGLGRGGVVLATLPFAALVAAAGWRGSFWWMSGAALILVFALLLVLARPAAKAPAAAADWPATRAHLRAALRSPDLVPVVLFQAACSAPSMTLLALWGAPWLADAYGMHLIERGWQLLALAAATAAAAPLWGLVPRLGRGISGPVLVGAGVTLLLLAAAAAVRLPSVLLVPWLAALGLASGFYSLVLTELKALLPPTSAVHGVVLFTAGTMVGVAATQLLSGLLIDLLPGRPGHHPPAAYRAVFALLAALIAGAMAVYWRRMARLRAAARAQAASTPATRSISQ